MYIIALLGVWNPAWSADNTPVKAFCVDFNWGPGGANGFAPPGHWADASPEAHVAWYQALGANTIQTFAVSCNGYAWYKGGAVPEQPGLSHDFLPEMVRLGHARGMRVMGYFCVGANTRWSEAHPELSYGKESAPNLVFGDAYLDLLAASVREALTKSGMDGFMVDWLWNPDDARKKHNGGKWLDAEKQLYAQIMGQPFPGEEQLTERRQLEFKKKNIERCWKRIREAAKAVKPDCAIWLTCNNVDDPSVADSAVFQEADWLMNEHPDPRRLAKVLSGPRPATQCVIQCVVGWGNQNDAQGVLSDKTHGIRDFYGFAMPGPSSLPLPVSEYLAQPIGQFDGNNRNIAALARYFNGLPDTYVAK